MEKKFNQMPRSINLENKCLLSSLEAFLELSFWMQVFNIQKWQINKIKQIVEKG
jgi:hypothetical protein